MALNFKWILLLNTQEELIVDFTERKLDNIYVESSTMKYFHYSTNYSDMCPCL